MYQDEAFKNVLPIQECYDYALSSDKRTAAFNRLFVTLQWYSAKSERTLKWYSAKSERTLKWYSAKSERTLKWYSMASDELGAICLAIIYMLCEMSGYQEEDDDKIEIDDEVGSLKQRMTEFIHTIEDKYNKKSIARYTFDKYLKYSIEDCGREGGDLFHSTYSKLNDIKRISTSSIDNK